MTLFILISMLMSKYFIWQFIVFLSEQTNSVVLCFHLGLLIISTFQIFERLQQHDSLLIILLS